MAWANDPVDRESEIYELICKGLDQPKERRAMARRAAFLLYSMIQATIFKETGSSMLFLRVPEESVRSQNLRTVIQLLQERSFLGDQYMGSESGDITRRRFFFPFTMTVCCKVNQAFGAHSYTIPEMAMERIRGHVRKLFTPFSFQNPVIYNQLYPVSSFTLSGLLHKEIAQTVAYVSDSIAHSAAAPRPMPRFANLFKPDREEYLDGLERDYRMIYGVACLERDISEDPLEFVRRVCRQHQLPDEYYNGIIGDVSSFGGGNDVTTRRIELARLTLNRPYPALDAYQHFIEEIHHEDVPHGNFWDHYRNF